MELIVLVPAVHDELEHKLVEHIPARWLWLLLLLLLLLDADIHEIWGDKQLFKL